MRFGSRALWSRITRTVRTQYCFNGKLLFQYARWSNSNWSDFAWLSAVESAADRFKNLNMRCIIFNAWDFHTLCVLFHSVLSANLYSSMRIVKKKKIHFSFFRQFLIFTLYFLNFFFFRIFFRYIYEIYFNTFICTSTWFLYKYIYIYVWAKNSTFIANSQLNVRDTEIKTCMPFYIFHSMSLCFSCKKTSNTLPFRFPYNRLWSINTR